MTMDKKLDEMFDHPCKGTCSGWQQGYDKGFSAVKVLPPTPSECAGKEQLAREWLHANGWYRKYNHKWEELYSIFYAGHAAGVESRDREVRCLHSVMADFISKKDGGKEFAGANSLEYYPRNGIIGWIGGNEMTVVEVRKVRDFCNQLLDYAHDSAVGKLQNIQSEKA
jgi:hypothetical protein